MTALTPEVLQKCAERLDYGFIVKDASGKWRVQITIVRPGDAQLILSDGELLNEILLRITQRGLIYELGTGPQGHRMYIWPNHGELLWQADASRPFEAAAIAFAQLPLEGGNADSH